MTPRQMELLNKMPLAQWQVGAMVLEDARWARTIASVRRRRWMTLEGSRLVLTKTGALALERANVKSVSVAKSGRVRVFVTRVALTRGIYEAAGKLTKDGRVTLIAFPGLAPLKLGVDCFATRTGAEQKAMRMAADEHANHAAICARMAALVAHPIWSRVSELEPHR